MLAVAGATAVGVSVHDMLRGGSVHLFFAARDTGDVCETLWTHRLGWRAHSLTRLFGLPPAAASSPVRAVGSSLGSESVVYVTRDRGHVVWCQKLYVDLDVERRPEAGPRSRAELMAWRCVDVTAACGLCSDNIHEEDETESEVAANNTSALFSEESGDEEDMPASAEDAASRAAARRVVRDSAAAADSSEASSRGRQHDIEPLPETLTYWVSVGAECIHFIDTRGRVHELSVGLLPGSRWSHRCVSEAAFAPFALLPPSSSSPGSVVGVDKFGGPDDDERRSALLASSSDAVFDSPFLMSSDGLGKSSEEPEPAGTTSASASGHHSAGLVTLRSRERATMRSLSQIEEILAAWYAAEAAGEDPGPLHPDIRPREREQRKKLQQVREAIRRAEVAAAPQNQLEFNMSVLQLPALNDSPTADAAGEDGVDIRNGSHRVDRSKARVLPPVLAGNPGYGGSQYLAFATAKSGLCLLRYGTGWFQTRRDTTQPSPRVENSSDLSDAAPFHDASLDDQTAASSSSGWWQWSKDVVGKGFSIARDAVGVVGDAARSSVPSWKAIKILKHCQDNIFRSLKDLEPLTILGTIQTSTGAELIFFADANRHLHELRWTQTHRHQWRHFDLTEHYKLPPVQRSAGLAVCDVTSTEGQMVLVYFIDESRRLHELRQFAVAVRGGNAQVSANGEDLTEPSVPAMNPWQHTCFSGDGSPDHPLDKLPPVSRLCSASVLPVSRESNASVIYFLDSGTNHVTELVLQWRLVKPNGRQSGLDFFYVPRWSNLTTDIADFPVPSRMGVSVYSRGVIQAFTNQASTAAKRAWKFLRAIRLSDGGSGAHVGDGHKLSESLVHRRSSFGDDEDDAGSESMSTASAAPSDIQLPLHPIGDPEIFRHRDAPSADKLQAQKELVLRQKYIDAVSFFRDQVDVNERLRADIAKVQQQLEASLADADPERHRRLQERAREMEEQYRQNEQKLRDQIEERERQFREMEERVREAQEREQDLSRARRELEEAEHAASKQLEEMRARIGALETEKQTDSHELANLKQREEELTRYVVELRGGFPHDIAVKIRQHDRRPGSPGGAESGKAEAAPLDDNNASLEDENECVVCLERPINVTLRPCGHRVLCDVCLDDIMGTGKCPNCRDPIAGHAVD